MNTPHNDWFDRPSNYETVVRTTTPIAIAIVPEAVKAYNDNAGYSQIGCNFHRESSGPFDLVCHLSPRRAHHPSTSARQLQPSACKSQSLDFIVSSWQEHLNADFLLHPEASQLVAGWIGASVCCAALSKISRLVLSETIFMEASFILLIPVAAFRRAIMPRQRGRGQQYMKSDSAQEGLCHEVREVLYTGNL